MPQGPARGRPARVRARRRLQGGTAGEGTRLHVAPNALRLCVYATAESPTVDAPGRGGADAHAAAQTAFGRVAVCIVPTRPSRCGARAYPMGSACRREVARRVPIPLPRRGRPPASGSHPPGKRSQSCCAHPEVYSAESIRRTGHGSCCTRTRGLVQSVWSDAGRRARNHSPSPFWSCS